jgi:hypothetical protein
MDYQDHHGNCFVPTPLAPVDHLVPLLVPLPLIDDHYYSQPSFRDQEDVSHSRNANDLDVAIKEMDYDFYVERWSRNANDLDVSHDLAMREMDYAFYFELYHRMPTAL